MPFNQLNLRFHAVGQGLFAFGEIRRPQPEPRFRWVYDCGTVSSQSLITDAIRDLRNYCGSERPHLDLVVLSHFDRDHISGLMKLLKTFSVRTLLLPYVPLWQRLIVAFNASIGHRSWMMRFLVNPVAYLSRLPGVDIGQIVFVPGVQGDDRAPGEGDRGERRPDNQPDQHRDNEVIIDVVPESEWDAEWQIEVGAGPAQILTQSRKSKVLMLRRGSALRWGTSWEFVPYNDTHVTSRGLPAFQKYVVALRDKLLRSPSKALLDQIKNEYDNYFGKDAKARNIISLFLYVGQSADKLFHTTHTVRTSRGRQRFREEHWPCPSRVGVVYTGDGYLNTEARIDRFTNYMGPHRMNRLLCLQVMHHGSRTNWREGLAEILQPRLSVFSSDPANKKLRHPHGEVVRDFLHYGPIQVDKYHDLSITCRIA